MSKNTTKRTAECYLQALPTTLAERAEFMKNQKVGTRPKKNKTNNKAIILNDEVISDNPEGGTGKRLFMQGVKQIRRTAILDGKGFDDKK